MLLDIDHFKRINDVYGHVAGDQALVSITRVANETISSAAGSDAMFARIGGEEFLLLLPGVALRDAAAVAEKLRRAIEATEIDSPAGRFSCTGSMGVAQFDAADGSFDGLLLRCDAALYEAKGRGRNCVRVD